jgi:hypothetical protein
VFGASLPSSPNTIASNIAPIEENIHPKILIPPYTAKAAGMRKTPEPIIFPITKAVLEQKPILFEFSILWIFLLLKKFKFRKKIHKKKRSV